MRHVFDRLWNRLREVNRELNRRPLAGHWFGHHAARWLVAAVLGLSAWAVVVELVAVPEWANRVVGALLMGVAVLAPSAMVDHAARPCDRRVSEMPLDPGLMAQRWHRYLSAFHHQRDHRIGWAAGTMAYIVLVTLAWWPGPLSVYVAYPLIIVPQVFDSVVTARHEQVRLWCPRCRRRDDGPRERTIFPSPTPVQV